MGRQDSLFSEDVDGVQDWDAGGGRVVLQEARVLVVTASGQGKAVLRAGLGLSCKAG